MALEDATQVLQLETGEAEGPTCSPFQKSARAGLQTTTHFKRAPCLVRAAGSRTSAIMKFGSARVTVRPRRVFFDSRGSRGCKSGSSNIVDVLQDMMDTAQNEVDRTSHAE